MKISGWRSGWSHSWLPNFLHAIPTRNSRENLAIIYVTWQYPARQHVHTVSLPCRLPEVCRGIERGNLGLHQGLVTPNTHVKKLGLACSAAHRQFDHFFLMKTSFVSLQLYSQGCSKTWLCLGRTSFFRTSVHGFYGQKGISKKLELLAWPT